MIGFFEHQKSGCMLYRTKHPMDMLNANGVPSSFIQINVDIDSNVYDAMKAVQVYGIYPFRFEHVLKIIHADGKRIVYDMDDALDLIDPVNPFFHAVKRDAGSRDEILRLIDQITVSTPVMRDLLLSKTDIPITVVPNCYEPKEWTFTRPKRGGIRIGFAGSPTHVGDLIDVIPAIRNLQAKYDVRFLIMGLGPSTYESFVKDMRYTCAPEGVKAVDELDRELSTIKFEWIPYVDYDNYPATLTNLALDIGLCPLKDTPFNRARSACKAMEYTLAGALAIASDMPGYRDDHSSVLVYEPNDWEKVLENYIKFPEIREEVRLQHLDWLQKNRKVDSQLEILKQVYGV
jgi:hypothetical protein